MATKEEKSALEKRMIDTEEILQKLKDAKGDNTEFFYLYVSTADKERKKKQSPNQQASLLLPFGDYEDSDDAESEDDEQMEVDIDKVAIGTTENNLQQISSLDGDKADPENNPSPPLSKDAVRNKAMNKVHNVVVPRVLRIDQDNGWKKVYDKDKKLTYRALYFNTIPKRLNEDDTAYIQRVGKIRTTLAKAVEELKGNFKFNSLLSKPFIYDEPTLAEQSMKGGLLKGHEKETIT